MDAQIDEIQAPFEASRGRVAGLELESAELFHLDNPYWHDDPAAFARCYVRGVTAWGRPLLLRAFAREGECRCDYIEALLVCRKVDSPATP